MRIRKFLIEIHEEFKLISCLRSSGLVLMSNSSSTLTIEVGGCQSHRLRLLPGRKANSSGKCAKSRQNLDHLNINVMKNLIFISIQIKLYRSEHDGRRQHLHKNGSLRNIFNYTLCLIADAFRHRKSGGKGKKGKQNWCAYCLRHLVLSYFNHSTLHTAPQTSASHFRKKGN